MRSFCPVAERFASNNNAPRWLAAGDRLIVTRLLYLRFHVGQAHRLPKQRNWQAERLPYNSV